MSEDHDQPEHADPPPVWGRPALSAQEPTFIDPNGPSIDPAMAPTVPVAGEKKRVSTVAKTLTAVSSTSVTVKSTDGFSATYVVGSGLDVSSFSAGNAVTVIAEVSGATVTATSVTAARTMGSTGGAGATGGSRTAGSGTTGSGQPTI